MACPAEVEAIARTRFDCRCPYARDISYSGFRNRRAPTLARRYQRGHRGTCCSCHKPRRSDGHYSSRDGRLRNRNIFCTVVPQSACAVRTQVRIEVPAPLGSSIGNCRCVTGCSYSERRSELFLNDWFRHIRCCCVHGWTDSCGARLPSVQSSTLKHARSYHPADGCPIRSATSSSCAKCIRT